MNHNKNSVAFFVSLATLLVFASHVFGYSGKTGESGHPARENSRTREDGIPSGRAYGYACLPYRRQT